MPRPTVAILGKPNVGKSTLFNRLVGNSQSIISPEEGVTRDRVYGVFNWQGKEFNLIDTGGYIPDSEDVIEHNVKIQAEIALNEADILIFVVDGRSSITSSDYYLAQQIQKLEKPYLLVVNKVDVLDMEDSTMIFYELGLGNFYNLSAQNNRQVGDMLDGIIQRLPDWDYTDLIIKDCVNLAIVGMPNVGKSSLMNALLKEEKSIVSSIAGTTRDSVDSYIKYYKQDIRLIDTAGLRKKSKIKGNIEYYSSVRTYRVISECDIAAVMIDANKGFNNQDKDIIRYVIDNGKGLIIIINKWDLLQKDTFTQKEFRQDIIDQYPALSYYPVIFISVLENLRIRQLLKISLEVFKERQKKLKTAELNNFIQEILFRHPPPLIKGRNITIKYGAQVRHSPPIFAFFSNKPNDIPIQYKRYIENSLRDYFGFIGVPFKISFREKK